MEQLNEMRRKYINLKQFYREPSEFITGDKAPGHEGWKVEIAMDKSNPDNFATLCYTNSGENPNDQLETFYESCAQGISGNLIVAQDYEIPYEAYLTKNGTTQEVYNKLTKPGLRQNVAIRASNSLMNIQKTFQGVITVSTVTSAPNVGMKISGSIKHFSGGINEEPIDPTASFIEAVGAITVGTLTSTTVPVTYDLTLNDANASDIVLRLSDASTEVASVPAIAGTGTAHEFDTLTPGTEYTVELYNTVTDTVISAQVVTTEVA